MERKIVEKLIAWKNNPHRKPLNNFGCAKVKELEAVRVDIQARVRCPRIGEKFWL